MDVPEILRDPAYIHRPHHASTTAGICEWHFFHFLGIVYLSWSSVKMRRSNGLLTPFFVCFIYVALKKKWKRVNNSLINMYIS